MRSCSNRECSAECREITGPRPQQHSHIVRAVIYGREILDPVAIEIAGSDPGRTCTGSERLALRGVCEGACAVSKQYSYIVAAAVGRCKVEIPITIEIADYDGFGAASDELRVL